MNLREICRPELLKFLSGVPIEDPHRAVRKAGCKSQAVGTVRKRQYIWQRKAAGRLPVRRVPDLNNTACIRVGEAPVIRTKGGW